MLVPAPWVFLPFSPILLLAFASFLRISLVKPQISIPYCQVRPYWIPRAFDATLEKRDMREWLYTENKIVSSTTLNDQSTWLRQQNYPKELRWKACAILKPIIREWFLRPNVSSGLFRKDTCILVKRWGPRNFLASSFKCPSYWV